MYSVVNTKTIQPIHTYRANHAQPRLRRSPVIGRMFSIRQNDRGRACPRGLRACPRGLVVSFVPWCAPLGFPWILSSESRLFNELRWIFSGRKFFALFCRWGGGAGTGAGIPAMQKCSPSTEILDSLSSPRDIGALQFLSRVRCVGRAKGTVFANPS